MESRAFPIYTVDAEHAHLPRDSRVVTLVGFVRFVDVQGRKAHYTHGDQRCEVLTFKAKSGPELFIRRLIMQIRMVISVDVLM